MRKWLLLGAVLLAWGGSLHVPYHFDDSHSVEGNAAIRSISHIPSFWTDPRTSTSISENRVYRPLLYTFYSICWWMGGGATWPFHLMKLLMHFFTSLSVYLIWRRLFTLPGWMPANHEQWKIRFPLMSQEYRVTSEVLAFFAALVFAVHPALSECVVYISSTTAMQAAMFMGWGFYFHLKSREHSGQNLWVLWALIFYFLAVASKEIGITLVALIGWFEVYTAKGGFKERVRSSIQRSWPYAVACVVLLSWFLAMRPAEGDASRGGLSSGLYFVSQWRAWLYYFRIWFWPFDLNADHAGLLFAKSFSDSFVIQALIGNLLLLTLAVAKRREWPAFLFGLIWFYIALSPDSSFVVLGEAIAERRMYASAIALSGAVLPLLFFVTNAGFGPLKKASVWGWLVTIAVTGLLIGAHTRVEVWSSGENLWKDTLEKNPQSGRAMNNLGLVYMGRGEFKEAIALFEKCEKGDWAGWSNCPLNLGIAFGHIGKFDEAKTAFLRALQYEPRSSAVHFFYAGFCEGKLKDFKQALDHYLISDQLTGGVYTAAKINAARMYMELKDWISAEKLLKDTLAFEPNSALAQTLLTETRSKSGK